MKSQIHNQTEIWKPVIGYSGYEVSSFGRVRSIDRIVHCKGPRARRRYRGRILRQCDNGIGYRVVTLRRGQCNQYVHRLVLEAFIGPCPPGCEGRHLNDDRANNNISNLAWGTKSQNYADAVRNGRRKKKMAEDIVRFQAGRDAAIAGQKRDGRKGKDWLKGYDQIASEGKAL